MMSPILERVAKFGLEPEQDQRSCSKKKFEDFNFSWCFDDGYDYVFGFLLRSLKMIFEIWLRIQF